jgi:hypothetical protein
VHAAVSRLQADLAVALGRPTLAAPELAHEVPSLERAPPFRHHFGLFATLASSCRVCSFAPRL